MKHILYFLLFFSLTAQQKIVASHIVGGEFQIQYSGKGYLYNVYLNIYYDDINANSGLINADLTINATLFNKTTNLAEKTIELKRNKADLITYTTNGCNNPNLVRTRLLAYAGSVDLTNLTNPAGYYLSWERCCRNYQTDNIVHYYMGDIVSGQAFYMEFPPVAVGGTRLINSSPGFNVAPAQYLCKDTYTLIDFSASDQDGDSLVYSLVTPLQGHTTILQETVNIPRPAPYKPITWRPGYSASNAIRGNPALSINSSTGILAVKPSETGIYAFAVLCEEYRDGIKIGEVRRDFQYLIYNCPVTYPPSVGLNAGADQHNNNSSDPAHTNWGDRDPDTIVVKLNRDTCYTIFVTDSNRFHGSTDIVNISYGATNLPRSALAFSPARVTISPAVDTARINMCFSTCDKVLIERDSVYFLDIIVVDGDDATCPRRSDTLRTYVYVDVDENNDPPVIGTTLLPLTTLTTYPDTLTNIYVYGLDPDLYDVRTIEAKGFRFSMEYYEMQFNKVFEGPDSVAYLFSWVPKCEYLDKRTEYTIDFILKDHSCIYTHSATTRITLKLEDVDTGLQNIIPSTLITPNGDNLNDCFYLHNLPGDNCTYEFKSVQIYNRWGANVYTSSDRNFRWCPDNVSDGVYYYIIDLKAKVIKSWLQIIR